MIGDALASGQKSADFSMASGISQFEDDMIFRPEIVAEKYGLTPEEVKVYEEDRNQGKKLPDLPVVESLKELATFKVTDKRTVFGEETQVPKLPQRPQKYMLKEYSLFRPILDRILIKRVPDDPNLEALEDGSMRDKRTGFIIPGKYRQHSNVGVILAVGDFVVMGGVKIPLSDIISLGDRVTFGDYNSEVFHMPDALVEKLCDSVQLDYEPDPEGLRIVRVQDVRGVEHPKTRRKSLWRWLWEKF